METERDIFRLFAEGNAEAFRKIFESFYPKVYGFVEHLVHDPDEAKDVTQKIFIRMWINRDKFLDVNDYDSYIFILSKYTVLNHIRHRKTPVTDAPLHDIRDSGSPEDKVQMQEIRKRVDGIVEKMPRQRRGKMGCAGFGMTLPACTVIRKGLRGNMMIWSRGSGLPVSSCPGRKQSFLRPYFRYDIESARHILQCFMLS